MQAATTGDYYQYTAFETDGVTPLNMSGYSSVTLAIKDPYGNVLTYTPSVNVGPPVIFYFYTTNTMFPKGGNYQLEFVINYGSGQVSKTRVDTLEILPSID